jgi:hypothetical protein
MLEIVAIWILFGVVTAIAAHARGRSPLGWFLIGILFSVFGLIAVLVMPRGDDAPQSAPAKFSLCPHCGYGVRASDSFCSSCKRPLSSPPLKPAKKNCPACFMEVDARATICGHCRTPLAP